jgi:hypothetical protein
MGHHIVLDGRSVSVLFTELEALYNGYLLEGRPPELAPPLRQLGDFVAWQASWLRSPAATPFLDHWRRQVPPGRLTADTAPASADYAGGRVQQEIPPAILARVRALARRENVTVATVCLAVYQALLRSREPRRKMIVGIPAANRGRAELAAVVGYLVNILPLPGPPEPGRSLSEAVRLAETAVGDAYAYQAMPIEHVVATLSSGARTSGARSTVPIDTLFAAYRDVMRSEPRMHSLRLGPKPLLPVKDAEFAIMLTVAEEDDNGTAMFSYQTSAYSRADAAALAAEYVRLLDAATQYPDRPLASLAEPT